MSIAAGTRFGPYEVVALVGAGGMGEVYRARDDRLGRDVALKVLHAGVSTDRDRLRRFEQEAKAAGALNHPNVVAIHDVGTQNGQPFLVTELLDGESLRQRLARGALPSRRAAEIAAQLAHGLAAAHARGILHRDLKPENLFLTRDGRAKILDFGIAKLIHADVVEVAGAPTSTSLGHTEVGMIVGTAGYMSPEQVQGRPVDHRSDLFALGTVFYEMLSGARAFPGTSQISTLNAIVESEPKELADAIPPAIQRIVRRCLEKDPEARFQTARDLAFALDGLTAESTRTGTASVATRPRLPKLAAIALAGLAGVLAGYVAHMVVAPARDPAPAAVRRFVFQPPPGAQMGGFAPPVLSPDGMRIVYGGPGGPQGRQLYSRLMNRLDIEPVAGTERGGSAFFSPDGQWVGFVADGKLKKVPLAGGAALTIADLPAGRGIHGASWGEDGMIRFTQVGSVVMSVPAEGGKPAPVTRLDESQLEIDHHYPAVLLPGGNAILYTSHAGTEIFRVAARALASGEQQILIKDGFQPTYVATGHLVFGRGSSLLAATFDPARLTITGPEVTLVENVLTFPDSGLAMYSVADDGTLAYVPAPPLTGRTLVWVDRSGKIEPFAMPPRAYDTPSLSPDGQRVAVRVSEAARSDVWIYRLADGAATRLGLDGEISRPQWTPDGQHLTLSVRRGEERLLIRQPVDGTADSEVLAKSARNILWAGAWTPDGQTLAYVENPPTDISDIKLRRPDGAVESLVAGPSTKVGPSFSPDGRWVAYLSDESGRAEIYIRPFPGPGVARQVSTPAGTFIPRWSRTGNEIFFFTPNRRMMAVPVRTSPSLDVGPPRELFELPFFPALSGLGPPPWDVTADGQRFIVNRPGAEELAPRVIHVVENWTEELKQRVKPGL